MELWEGALESMVKIYVVVIRDYDLYGKYGYYFSKAKAKKRLQELKNDPAFLWKEYLEIEEQEVIE